MHFMDATDLIEMHLFVGISTKRASFRIGAMGAISNYTHDIGGRQCHIMPKVFEENHIDA